MKLLGILALAGAVSFCPPAMAVTTTQLSTFDGETLSNTIKCEVGSFAKYLPARGIPAAKLKVKVSITDKTTSTSGGGVIFRIPIFSTELSGLSESTLDKILRINGVSYNIHAENAIQNCRKNNRIKNGIGILECLKAQKAIYLDAVAGGGSADCSTAMTIKRSGNVKAGLPIWNITVGPSGSLGRTTAFTVETSAPPSAK